MQQLIDERDMVIQKLQKQNADNLMEETYREQKRYFARVERTLDACKHGPDWLKNPSIANLVTERMRAADGKTYELLAYCVMPNHVHLVIDTANQLDKLNPNEELTTDTYQQLYRTLGAIKGGSAFEANQLLNRKGAFWQPESYDHWVRDAAELTRIIEYVLLNPVKAGLVANWQDWPYTYVSERIHGL